MPGEDHSSPHHPRNQNTGPDTAEAGPRPMETEALKNYPFTLLERQLVSRPVLGNLARLKDSGPREGKYLQCRHSPHLTGKDHPEPM